MSVPVTLSPDPKSLDPITAATGLGAFVIGGVSQGGGSQWGQNLNESFIKSLWELPTITLTNMLEVLAEALRKLPLAALQQFEALFPFLADINWTDPESIINGILSQIIPKPIMQTIEEFESWVNTIFKPLFDLVNSMLGPFASLLGGTGTGADIITSGLSNLFGLFGGSTNLAGASSVFSGLTGDVGNLGTAFNQIGDLFSGVLTITPVNEAVQQVKDLVTGLFSFETGIATVQPGRVQGIQGIEDMVATFGHIIDGLSSAYNQGSITGASFTDLFTLAQQTAQNAENAFTKAIQSFQILGIRFNMPVFNGMHPTSEATYPIAANSSGASPPTTAIPAGTSMAAMYRVAQDAPKGFIEFLGQLTSGTGVYANVFKVDPVTKVRTALWNSGNISGNFSGTLSYIRVNLPSSVHVAAGDLLHLEIVNAGATGLAINSKQLGLPNHPLDFPPNMGATRTTASSGGATPTTVADTAVSYSGTVPWINFGINNLPPGYEPPVPHWFTAPGDYTVALPSWFRPGIDYCDRVGVGAGGGGGQCSFGGGFNGTAGQATTFTSTGRSTLVANGGGGGLAAANNSGNVAAGPGPGNYDYQGTADTTSTHHAGGAIVFLAPGNPPGGAGSGGSASGFFGLGGGPGAWAADTIQPTNSVSIHVGTGGFGGQQGSGNGGYPGAAGYAYVEFRQNPNV